VKCNKKKIRAACPVLSESNLIFFFVEYKNKIEESNKTKNEHLKDFVLLEEKKTKN